MKIIIVLLIVFLVILVFILGIILGGTIWGLDILESWKIYDRDSFDEYMLSDGSYTGNVIRIISKKILKYDLINGWIRSQLD